MKLLMVVHHRFDLWNAPAWFSKRLREEFPALEIVHRDRYEDVEEHLRDAEILFAFSLRAEQFNFAQKLRWIHAPTAAVHQLLFPELVKSDVVLTNAREVHGPVVAEHVIALIFALAKKIPQAVRLQQKRVWGQDVIWNDGPRPREVAGETLGLIGLGSIGRTVARIAAAMGMRVVAIREHPEKEKPEGVAEVYAPPQLDQLLSQANYVVMAAPLTEATRRLMNAERLAAMRPDAYLINVGRGLQVDEAALGDALRSHRIAGAALDVFEQEPLPPESPLWALENLLITPHTAGLTEKLWHRHYTLFSENLRRYLAREPLLFTVDKQKGY
ncbi:MAG TPA: D-2-hydroxyacid dehydrogenase [Candidatus Acidoferrum sp.]|jgi:phosphoglycerate dehydrogenase-like enzyme|nr:D-2-hydroxyacid dehydrogenase [Candidatus Acidoferrum sp.]